MNHRLNDLLPRAVTAKAFVSIPHPASWQRFTPEHTRATLQLLMSCVTAPTGSGQVGRRGAGGKASFFSLEAAAVLQEAAMTAQTVL